MSGKKFDRAVLESFKKFMDLANATAIDDGNSKPGPLGQLVTDYLGLDATGLPVVSETIADHRLVDADIASEKIGGTSDQVLHGVSGR